MNDRPADLGPELPESPGSMAAKCRRLADAIGDGPTREALLKLAEDYEVHSGPERGRPDPLSPQATH